MITFEDFTKLDIRIGTIVSVEKIPEADKLLKFTFDFGAEKRQIVSALAPYFPDPSVLVGKQLPVLINLEPKTLRGYESEGMILSIVLKGEVVLLIPEIGVPPGAGVR